MHIINFRKKKKKKNLLKNEQQKSNANAKFRDHCHHTGEYRGAAKFVRKILMINILKIKNIVKFGAIVIMQGDIAYIF